MTASNAVPSKPVYGFAPLTCVFQSAANALPAGPPAALAAVPRSPTTGLPIAVEHVVFRSASVMNVFEASHLPVRTSDGANFWNVSGKSMITQPAGLPETSWLRLGVEVRLVRVPEHVVPDLAAERLVLLGDEQRLQRGAEGVVARADVERRALAERPTRRLREHLALERVGRIEPPEVAVVLDRGELRRARGRRDLDDVAGIVTDWAIGIVAPEAISPMSTLALFDLTSFVAASTEALACVWPSSEPTSLTWICFARPAFFSAVFCEADRELDRPVHVPAVRGEVAGEGQDVADLEVECARRRAHGGACHPRVRGQGRPGERAETDERGGDRNPRASHFDLPPIMLLGRNEITVDDSRS